SGWVRAYDTNGNTLWTAIDMMDVVTGIAIGPDSNVVATGYDLDDLPVNVHRAVVAKLSGSDGTNIWKQTYELGSTAQGRAVALDGANNVVVTGSVGTANGASDGLILKYDQTGALLWSNSYGASTADENFWGVAIDSVDNITVVGSQSESDV